MTLVSVKPQFMRPRFTHWMDSLLDSEFAGWEHPTRSHTPVAVNTKETADRYVLEVAAPGFSKDQFKLSVDHQVLTLQAEKEVKETDEKETYTRREHSYTSVKRSFTLPKQVDVANIAAEYKEGILYITLPKVVEAQDKAAIEIKVG